MKKIVLLSLLILTYLGGIINSQTVTAPNSALKSHETLDITKIVLTAERTEIYLTVENRITGGTFCADKNIIIAYPDGSRLQMISSNGIPVCPDAYKFRNIGERLDFVLAFPPLKQGTVSFDLLEDCQDNCFSFYSVVIDPALNEKINGAFVLAEKHEPAQALAGFSRIESDYGGRDAGVEGLLLLNMIKLAAASGNKTKAQELYHRLELAVVPWKALYLKHLNSQGIK
jgi:hypothetical protein